MKLPVTDPITINCERLHCAGLRAVDCVRRQIWAKRRRTKQTSRGQSYDCDSCLQGQAIKTELGPVFCRHGSGPNRIFDPGRDDRVAQWEAEMRQARAGLLAPVKSMDEPRGEEAEDEAAE